MKKVNKKIKAVIFDIGGVLEVEKKQKLGVHEYIAKKFKISVDQWFDSIDSSYSKSIEGLISEEEVIFIISKNLKTTPKKLIKIVIKAYKRHFKHNKELYKIAFKLKEKGYKIAILSDQWHLSKYALVDKKNTEKFDSVVLSCDSGIRKPNPKIYKIVLRKLNISAEESVFIDNQEWNTDLAKKIGMNIIKFEDNKKTIQDLNKLGIKLNGKKK